MTKPLRQSMPTVAAFIDDLREAFGADMINAAIRTGMDGQGTFRASENGNEVGSILAIDPEKTVSLAEIHLGPFNPINAAPTKGKR